MQDWLVSDQPSHYECLEKLNLKKYLLDDIEKKLRMSGLEGLQSQKEGKCSRMKLTCSLPGPKLGKPEG